MLVGAFGGASQPGFAQSAGQITPPTFAPRPSVQVEPVIIPEGSGAAPPAGAEKVSVAIGDISITGAAPSADALDRIKSRLIGHPVTIAEVYAAAGELEAGYARSGRVLVRVVVPPQSLAAGATLRLSVVEGFIERIDTTHVPAHVAKRLAAILAPLQGRTDLLQADIERRLLLAVAEPGIELRSTLTAGAAPGAVVLVVEARYRPVSGFLVFDNSLSDSLGGYTTGFGVNLNASFGFGETIYARVIGYPGGGSANGPFSVHPINRQLVAGLIAPIGHDGLTLNIEAVAARTDARHEPGFPGFGSRFQRLSGQLRYPLLLRRSAAISGQLSFDAQDEHVDIVDPLSLPISLDRLRIARLALDGSAALSGLGTASARVQASFGIDALGARPARDATALLPLSRAGADDDFHKIEFEARLDVPAARHIRVSILGHGQYSFGDVMANSEQIGLAAPDGISSLPSGTLQGDNGIVGRGELAAPFALPGRLAAAVSPYIFAAVGHVTFEQPTALERRTSTASAFGAGARLSLRSAPGGASLALAAEYGRARISGEGHSDRLSISIVARY